MQNRRSSIVAIAILLIFIALSIVSYLYAGSQTTSSTLASSIIDQARKYLNDPTTYGGTQYGLWSDSEMLQWVNDGSVDIVARTHCLEDVETETLLTDTIAYTLSDPFIVIKCVIYNDTNALKKGTIDDIGRTGSSDDSGGEPTHWAQWENDVIVYPAPDSDASGNEIDVYVIDRPTDVAGTENILLPAQYDRALVYYVVAQALKKDNRLGGASAYIAEYLAELERFGIDFNVQPKDKAQQ